MKFLTVILMTAWVTAMIEASRCKEDDLRPHYGFPMECHKKHLRMQMNSNMKSVMCKPRSTMVKLIPEADYDYSPNYVTVNRCSGYCPGKPSCMPRDKRNVTIGVKAVYGGYHQCFLVSVEEHINCKCQCDMTENDCNIRQKYSEKNCACECKKRKPCTHQMEWDENKCECICNKEEICSSGLEWVPSRCRCAQVMDMSFMNRMSNMNND